MKIRPILLASGNSKRFGENKLLYHLNNKPMICYIMDELFFLVQKNIIETPFVVTQYEEISTLAKERSFMVFWNDFPKNGISESIKIGVSANDETDGYMFFTGDQPYLKSDVIEGFLMGYKNSKKNLGCVVNEDIWCSPTIFSKEYREELLSLSGDSGGKKILQKNRNDIFFYNVDFKTVKDIDEKMDLDISV